MDSQGLRKLTSCGRFASGAERGAFIFGILRFSVFILVFSLFFFLVLDCNSIRVYTDIKYTCPAT